MPTPNASWMPACPRADTPMPFTPWWPLWLSRRRIVPKAGIHPPSNNVSKPNIRFILVHPFTLPIGQRTRPGTRPTRFPHRTEAPESRYRACHANAFPVGVSSMSTALPLLPVISFLAGLPALAADAPATSGPSTSPSPTTAPEVMANWSRSELRLTVMPPPGEHLSPDAPVTAELALGEAFWSLRVPAPQLREGLTLSRLSAGPTPLEGSLDVGICRDDGNTCRVVHLPIAGSIAGKRGSILLQAAMPADEALAAAPASGDVEAALQRASVSGKPVLIDFSTEWCPPCQTLAAEVLHDPADADLLRQFEVVEVDADASVSFPWKDRYAVTGYPTLIVAQPDGALVARRLGYDGEAEFLAWLRSTVDSPSIEVLRASLDTLTPDQLPEAARRLMDEGHDDEAAALIARIADPGTRVLLQFRQAPTHELLPAVVAEADEHIMEWIWTVVYELFQDDATPEESRELVRQAILKRIHTVSREQAAELAYVLADLTPAEHHPQRIFALGAVIWQTAFVGDPVADRGRTSFLIDLLARAEDHAAALAVADQAIQDFPDEFTYHHKRSGVLEEMDRLEEAAQSSETALQHASGDTILSAAMTLARLQAELGACDAAKHTLTTVLAQVERPAEEQKVRTWAYIQQAEDQLKSPCSTTRGTKAEAP